MCTTKIASSTFLIVFVDIEMTVANTASIVIVAMDITFIETVSMAIVLVYTS